MKTKNLDWSDIENKVGPQAATEIVHAVKKSRRTGWIWEAIAIALVAAVVALFIFGCATRSTYTTIAATHQATKLAYDGYVDSVITGQTKTNDLPRVSQAYNLFLASERVAIDAAQGNANATAPPDLKAQSATVIQQIDQSKAK